MRSTFGFWTAKFLADLGLSDVSAIINSSVFPLVGIAGSLLLGWYTDRYATDGNRARAMWVMLLGLVVSLFLIAMLVPYRLEFKNWIVVLTGACGFFLIGPYSMISGCLTLDIAGSEGGGTCTGMLDGFGYLGGTLAAWGTGVLSDKLGWSQVFYILSGFSILVVMSAYRISQLYRSKSEEVRPDLVPSPNY